MVRLSFSLFSPHSVVLSGFVELGTMHMPNTPGEISLN